MTPPRSLAMVWAQTQDGVIGMDGGMPWHLPEDLARFRTLTRGGTVVMGRRTWESLPDRFRPLPGRRNIVLTRRDGYAAPGADVRACLDEALAEAAGEDVWVIGGAQVYAAAQPLADRLEVTEIATSVEGDTHAPAMDADWRVDAMDPATGWHRSTGGLDYRWVTYRR